MAGPTVYLRPKSNPNLAVTLKGSSPFVVMAPVDPENTAQQWTVEDVPGGKAFLNRFVYDQVRPNERSYLSGNGPNAPLSLVRSVGQSSTWQIGADQGDGFSEISCPYYRNSLSYYDAPDSRAMLLDSNGGPRFQWKADDANAIAGRLLSSIVAVRTPDGTANVFGIGLDDNALYQINQSVPAGGPWNLWSKVPGYSYCKQIAAAVINDGRIEVAAVGEDDYIYLIAQKNDGSWRQWVRCGVQRFTQVVLVCNRDGGLTAIGIGLDSIAYSATQIDPQADTWTDWQAVDANTTLSSLTAIVNIDRWIELFGIATSGRALHNIQGTQGITAPPAKWTGWQPFDQDTNATLLVAAAGNKGDPRTTVVALNGHLQVATRSDPSQRWSNWLRLPSGDLEAKTAAVVSNFDGRFMTLGVDPLRDYIALWSAQSQPDGSDWSGWAPIGAGGFKQVLGNMNPGGRVEAYAIGLNDALYVTYQRDPGSSFAGWWWLGPGGR